MQGISDLSKSLKVPRKVSKDSKPQLLVYRHRDGSIELRSDSDSEKIWATQAQIAEIFKIERSVVTKHISNLLGSKEIAQKSNVQKMHIPNSDKPVSIYSLDIVLAVGYRTNSAKAIQFRRWATKILRAQIIDGYSIDKKRAIKNHNKFLAAVESVKKLLPKQLNSEEAKNILSLISDFSKSWSLLDAYDKNSLPKKGANKHKAKFEVGDLYQDLIELKRNLVAKKEASEFFLHERDQGALAGIIGNVFQSFDESDLYPSVEEKAAHLLYFIIKNHPFIDGNKRSGAFAFIWFLRRTKLLNKVTISPETLASLTLLISESNPKEKEKMIGLVLGLLQI